MALGFPLSPTLNQTYTVGTRTWRWNGKGWELVNVGPTGPAGPVGATGIQGPTGPAGGGPGGSSVTVSTTAPVAPTDGDLWWEPTQNVLSVWESASSSWVNVNGNTDDWGLITGVITIYDDYGSIT